MGQGSGKTFSNAALIAYWSQSCDDETLYVCIYDYLVEDAKARMKLLKKMKVRAIHIDDLEQYVKPGRRVIFDVYYESLAQSKVEFVSERMFKGAIGLPFKETLYITTGHASDHFTEFLEKRFSSLSMATFNRITDHLAEKREPEW